MASNMQPFNGDYVDSNGNIRNLMELGGTASNMPKNTMMPFNGDFYASDGSVHNLDEFIGSGVGGQGLKGDAGKSAYEIAVEKGFVGTETQWLAALKGADGSDGIDGQDGADGKSAYEIAVNNGFKGTEEEWLSDLKGERGVGIFYMKINEKGELIMGAADEESKPPLSINEDGCLIYTI